MIEYVADCKGHARRYSIDPTKIHEELGWLPETKFEDGIKATFSGTWITVSGGRKSSAASIATIMNVCIKINC